MIAVRDNKAVFGGGRDVQVTRRSLLKLGGMAVGGAMLGPTLAACSGGGGGGGSSTGTVQVWWNSGFYESENKAVQAIAQDWAKQSGNKIDLQFYSTDAIPTKEQSAITSGVLPDVVMAENGNTSTYAYQGKLADVSDVVSSQQFTSGATQAVHLFNSQTGKSADYAVPINQFTVPMFFWKDMLTAAGSDPTSIPNDWDGFWKYFESAQGAYRSKTGKQAYAVGWPMSTSAGDTNYDTQMMLMAFDAMLLDESGKLQADDPKIKANMAKALGFLAALFKDGYTPKDVVNWDDSGNNTAFLNKTIILTPNGSLSIPGSIKDTNHAEWANIVTQPFPNKPDGSGPVPSLAQVHNAVIFEDSPNKDAAKDFLKFFVKPENTLKYLKAGHGRWHPVQTQLLQNPYFANSDDPNIKTGTQMLEGQTQRAWLNTSVAYNHAALQGLWGKTIGQIVLQGQSPAQAADYAAQQLKLAFSSYPQS